MPQLNDDDVRQLIEDWSPMCENEERIQRLERLVDHLWKIVHELPLKGDL